MTFVERIIIALGLKVARRRGRRLWIVCPFHESTSTSTFFVRGSGERAGNYHCFACENNGGLTALVMHMRNCDAKTAKAFIKASGKNFEPPRVRARVIARPPMLARARFALPRECYFEPLEEWVAPAREYAEGRGITAEEVERYGLGYAVEGRLAGRIIFPVRVRAGARVMPASYSARTFVDDEPKYLTPRESENYDKNAMFGEHLWPNPGERGEHSIIVCEGAINALAAARDTGMLATSLSGSHVQSGHGIKLATFKRVIHLVDPDDAGEKMARQLASVIGRHTEYIRVMMPLVMNGAKRVRKRDAADMKPGELTQRIERATSKLAS